MFKPMWRFRPPPENAGILEMCKSPHNCLFGNTCPRAHSVEEFQEWGIRISNQIHDQKRLMIQGQQLPQLQVEYIRNSINENKRRGLPVRNVLAEVSSGRSILSKQNLFVTHLEKNKEISWEFTVKTNFKHHNGPIHGLQNVFFLETDCREFSFSGLSLTDNGHDEPVNIHGGEIFLPNYSRAPVMSAKISLKFSSSSYGHFNATVIFDFGLAPRIVRYVGVVVAPEKHLFEKLSATPTAPSDQKHNELSWVRKYKVVSYDESAINEVDSLGAGEYSLPANLHYGVEYGAFEHMDVNLTRENYRDRLHHLLFVEEYERRKLMSRLNVHCHDVFTLFRNRSNLRSMRTVVAQKALFVPVSEETLEEIGILVSRGSKALIRLRQFVYGATNDSEDFVLHEALVTNILSGEIVLEISSKTLTLLKSMTSPVPIDICFRFVNTFLSMHSAIDRVDLDLIFYKNFMERDIPPLRHSLLSPNQTAALSRVIYSSPGLPMLLLGPFGTGKTQTVAEAVKILISKQNASRRCRILICTHSNSAADHYIEDYLHPMFKNNDENYSSCEKPLRLYWEHRLATSISDTMLPYCIMDLNTGTFRNPSLEELERKTIVVTTLVTADMLIRCGVKPGFFTHIFIDEAAQAMELETLIPISLATEETKVVLAGDHLQLSPPIFSAIGRKLLLDKSLLVRLYESYPANSPRKILLLENFRSYPEIVNIPSKLFYEGSLVSMKQLPGDLQYPVKFYGVHGLEEKAKDSPSYVNMAEVAEVAERVEEMVNMWPKEHFGELKLEKTCVLCAHYAQIRQIRRELRLNGFSDVRVENVNNVQGLEFDVLFLSIVRTSRLLGPGQHEGKDLGFLSNPKLLNTAITRAKFCLVVIGDPKALCSIGDCRVCWKTILSLCSENGTFNYRVPLTQVLSSIREEQTQTVPPAINNSVLQPYPQPYVAPPIPNHFAALPRQTWTFIPQFPDTSMTLPLHRPSYFPIHSYSLPQTNLMPQILVPEVSNSPVLGASKKNFHAGSQTSPDYHPEIRVPLSPYRNIMASEIDDKMRNFQAQSQDKFSSQSSESTDSLAQRFEECTLSSYEDAKHLHSNDSLLSQHSPNGQSSLTEETVEKPEALSHLVGACSIEEGSPAEHEAAWNERIYSDSNSEDSHELCVSTTQSVSPTETSEEAAMASLCQTIRQNITNCLRNITETEEAVNMSFEIPLEDELVKIKIKENLMTQLSLLKEQNSSLQQQQVWNRILAKSIRSRQEKSNLVNFSVVQDRVEIYDYSLSSAPLSRMTHIQKINLDSDNEVQEWYRLRRQDPIVQDYIKSFEMLSERARARDHSQNQMTESCEISGGDNTDLASTLRGWVLQPQSVFYPCGSSWYEEHLSSEKVAEKLDNGEVVPCTLSVDKSSSGKSATCVVDDPSEKNIHIPDRQSMNRAFNTDYVAVEITQDLEDQDLREGKVVAILQEKHHRHVVCRLASPESTLMIPLNNVNPKFSILQSDNHVGQTGVAVFDTKGDQIQFQHFVSDVQHKLFLVQFLKWDVSYRYPLGFVAKCFNEYSDLRSLVPVLCSDFGIPNEFPVAVTEDIEKRFPESWQIPDEERQRRTRYEDAFTIDSKGAEELDDAISVHFVKYGVYKITIHVADVSYFVKKDSLVDKAAQTRATSVYLPPPSNLSVTLLPKQLGHICSLKPGKERLAVSVEFVIDLNGNIIRSPKFRRSIVVSQLQLSFEQVDGFLTGPQFATTIGGASTPLLCSLQTLYLLTRALWARRVCAGSFQACAESSMQSPSRRLVEELMIITNMAVADKLSNFPDSHVVPFRIQRLPKYNALQKLASWAADNELNLNETWLTQWLIGFQERDSSSSSVVCVDLRLWQGICQAVKSGIVADLTEGILSVHKKSPITTLIPRIQRLLPKSKYITSNQYSSTERRHFALNVDCYTHFTSPIRRYFDIVVHRVLFSETTAPIYDGQEMEVLCSMLNLRCGNAAALSMQFGVVCEAQSLQKTDGWKTMEVESVEAEYMTLKNDEDQNTSLFQKVKWGDMGASLCHKEMTKFVGCWTFHDVNLSQGDSEHDLVVNRPQASPAVPRYSSLTGCVSQGPTLRAQLSTANDRFQRSVLPMPQDGGSYATLDLETKSILEIPVEMWCKLLQASKEENITAVVKSMEIINKHAVFATNDNPSSEKNDQLSTSTGYLGCNNLKLSFQCGDKLETLFSCSYVSGLPQPVLQAIQVVPESVFCIQHHRQPVECFCEKAKIPARERYSSVEEYQRINISLLKMESAERSVHAGLPSIQVRNVVLKWTKDASNVIRDHLYIPGNKLLPSVNIHKDDFVCVHRHSGLNDGSSKARAINVTHGHIEDVVILKGNDHYIQLVLNSACTIDLPGEGVFTVEIIPQCFNYRRMITAVRNLPHAPEEVRSLFLTRDLHSPVKQGTAKKSFPSSFTLDPSQKKAMEKAIHSSITIIEGLPGTGKTYIAAAIAEQFYLENSLQKPMSNGIVLFCCPTDLALNDAENVLSRVPTIRLLRVYNRQKEAESFPDLTTVYGVNPIISDSGTHTISQESALHFKIRSKSNPFHRKIQKYAQQLNILKENVKDSNQGDHQQLYRVVEEYKKLIDMAEEFEFTERDVNIILCPCIEAGSLRVQNHARIKQCVMDESHLCLEAESLVVFQTLGKRCDHVVVLGDSRLESVPAVENTLARTFGLNRSLFSSLKNARGKKRLSKVVLETQHRILGL